MSSLLLAPFNDSMRLGQGYNSFLHTPCLGNAVDIKNATFIETKGESTQPQTVSYSARFVEKMSDVVQAMNISAGSSIRTGSVSVSGGGNNIDEIKFTESDLNAVISVKVINQTRNLRENISFKEIDVKGITNSQFHDIYGNTFISGFIEGGDLHGIISIKTIDASKKSEVKSALRSQFNSAKSEWSPSSSAALSEALRQTEVTVTVNWSGGGIIKPSNEEWTIDSLIRVASAFADNVAQCPQRTWAILTRYDTVPDFIVWAHKLDTPVTVRRYEGVQRLTSELLDMYIEYKGNLLILNDAIRHQDRYDESKSDMPIVLKLEALIEARKALRAEMDKIVCKIEALDKDPGAIGYVQKDEITAPELWRARLPFRKDIANEAVGAQSLVESLFKGLPIHSEPDDKSSLSEQLDTKELQLKLAQSEETNNAILLNLEEAKSEISRLQSEVTLTEEAKNAGSKSLEEAKTEIALLKEKLSQVEAKEVTSRSLEETKTEVSQLKNKPPPPPEMHSVAWWRREGLCPEQQRAKMPRLIREWSVKNAQKWSDCRISWLFTGLKDISVDGSSQFQCTLDHIGPEDKHVVKVVAFMRPTYICGLRVYYVSKKEVDHGDCTSPLIAQTHILTYDRRGWCIACSAGVEGRPKSLNLIGSDGRTMEMRAPELKTDYSEESGRAPPGYFLRGFWTQYEGDGLQRLGFIWGLDPSIVNPSLDWYHWP